MWVMNPHERPADMKSCSKCNSTKPESEFYPKGKRADGSVRYMAECKMCYSARSAQDYEKRKVEVLKRQAKYRQAKKDSIAAYMRDYYQANREQICAKSKAYQSQPHRKVADKARRDAIYAQKRETILARQGAYNAQRREEQQEKARQRYAANPVYFVAKGGERRARRVKATPKWVSLKECQTFYEQAKELSEQTGVKYVVDHIVPLKGRGVSGLHVPWNLRVITQAENLRKSNRLHT